MIKKKIALILMSFSLLFGTVLFAMPEQQTAQASVQYSGINKSINQIMTEGKINNSNNSVVVRKASSGEIVYQYNGDKGITPASTLKLLTSAAALETLGEEFRFTTDILVDGPIENGLLKGNLYLRGQGDPTLLKKDFDNFAIQVSKLGIKQITGNIVGDDTYFDAVRLSPSIEKKDEPYYYAAQISALTVSPNEDYDAGTVIVTAKPTVPGKITNVSLAPATGTVRIVNWSKTVPKGNKNTLKITRQHGTNTILITGNSPIGTSGKQEWITVSDPTYYALDVFKKSLAGKGIQFIPSSKVVRGKTPETADVIATKNSMNLKDLMKPFLKLSNNTHAEVLAKTMGKVIYGEGSWDAGLQVMRDYSESVGLDGDKWLFEDASGMSGANKVSSAQLTELLYLARSAPWYQSFLAGIPNSGGYDRIVGGTLRNRLKTPEAKGKVLAKTGSLDNVSSLAGYATSKDGEVLIFSILTENSKKSTVPVIDRIATAIVNSSR
ncbi:D-alanyl-D-alanine carboxypeptidase/D-alanyl-D-alanine endopeptidase [Sporosarcina sp. FA9]|uniref:D-alanyl-D-alanine carboxypeptidase/D-alanyl-D-alanine endopeptidase n=1 Tax=Sporosarcina sp. FA9 TaxID=3413030 RepID=UPI003F65ED04